jgi:caffeoyl-CoA O-methyltransferase
VTEIAIADPAVEAYAAAHSTRLSPALEDVANSTRAFSRVHMMMVDATEARLLALLVAVAGARRILEVGTFTGFSALAMAEALPPDGRIVTLEVDPAHAAKAHEHIAAAGASDRVEVRVGPALDSLRDLDGPFDMAFIDADKPGYPDYYEAVLPLVRPGGLIVADNVLRSGQVLDGLATDAGIVAMRRFNERVATDPRVECVMLTIRDGVTLIRRRG